MTTVIELYGSPGSGKSTKAAEIFCLLKKEHYNVELVREYVKDWMYLDRKVGTFDQFYILAKQLQKESIAYGKVDYLISDCPLWLIAFYEEYRLGVADGPCTTALHSMKNMLNGVSNRVRLFIPKRDFPHSDIGREHGEEESIAIQIKLETFLWRNHINCERIEPDQEILVENITNFRHASRLSTR